MKLGLQEAIGWTAQAFERHGCSPDNARSVARALLAAEADGLKGHGLSRIPTYLAMLATGKVDGKAVPAARRTAPGVLAVDAADGFAYPAIDLAIGELPAIARAQGIAVAAVTRSNHCGAAGHHVEALARDGLVAMMFANAPAAIAPWGGRTPIFGTNPIAFAAPLAGAEPIVIDLSVSKVARGNILAAKQKGQPIPEGWALDADGNATTDANAALSGTMVPLGDAKGAALALLVEILSACVIGANLSKDASTFFDGEGGPPGVGQMILAFDPSAFGHGSFSSRLTDLAQSILGESGTRLPGARRVALRQKAAMDGLTIPQEVVDAVG
jgi:(2R)-3-sulfolactate dehydrogenase (NADP+)